MWIALREQFYQQRRRLLVVMVIHGIILSGLLTAPVPVSAQPATTEPPNYRLTAGINAGSSDDALEINIGVINSGGAAQTDTQVEVVAIDGGDEERVVAGETLRPLGSNNDRETFILRVPFAQFEPGSRQVFQVRVVGLPSQPTIASSPLSVNIPVFSAPTVPSAPSVRRPELRIPSLNIVIDLNNREQVALALTVVACALLLLLLLIRLFRLLFVRRPDFKIPWQPPYATVPPLDPHSASGIRQAWQPLAQSNLISTPPTQGALQSIKLLLGTDDRYLSGWQVHAVRIIQYDQYGRVNRTETLMQQQAVRQLNHLIHQNHRLDAKRMMKRVRPIARQLMKQFRRKMTARSAMLPIALDIRLKGKHGEVNIVFELFHFDQMYWQLIDRWQPEMMIVSKSVQENYTYSLYGQSGGEKLNVFYRRLSEDLTRTLADFVGSKPEEPTEAPFIEPPVPDAAMPITTQGEVVSSTETGDFPVA